MKDEKLLEDPTNRVVSSFDDKKQVDAARKELLNIGLERDQIRVLQGEEAAARVDTSPKWFADTDVEIKRYQRELKAGNTVVSVPIIDSECREKVHEILKRHNAQLITHFGEWIIETMK